MSSSRRVAGAAVVLAIALSAGCTAHPGVAAVVDGRTITQDYLEDASADLQKDPAWTLSLLVAAPYYIEVAEDNGVAVSTQEARTAFEEALADAGKATAISDGAVEVMRLVLATQAVSDLPHGAGILSETEARVLELDMEINPRYGDVDPATGEIARTTSPWIVSSDV